MITKGIRDNIREYPDTNRDVWISYEAGRLNMLDMFRIFLKQADDTNQKSKKIKLDD